MDEGGDVATSLDLSMSGDFVDVGPAHVASAAPSVSPKLQLPRESSTASLERTMAEVLCESGSPSLPAIDVRQTTPEASPLPPAPEASASSLDATDGKDFSTTVAEIGESRLFLTLKTGLVRDSLFLSARIRHKHSAVLAFASSILLKGRDRLLNERMHERNYEDMIA